MNALISRSPHTVGHLRPPSSQIGGRDGARRAPASKITENQKKLGKNRDSSPTVAVLIPAFAPDSRLPHLVATLRRDLRCAVLVVDDGSGPEYAAIFETCRRYGAVVEQYERNAGKGQALKCGLARAANLWPGADVVCADADGQHTPADIAAVAQRVRATGHLTLGVREFTGHVPLRSRLGNAVTALLFRGATGWALRDTQTGLRGYPAGEYAWMLDVPGQRYEYELSALLQAKARHMDVEQVAIATVYEPGNASSHFRPIRDSLRIYAPLLAFTASSLCCFVLDWLGVLVVHALTGSLLTAVVTARIGSGCVNFALNRRVFSDAGPLGRTALRYLTLALALMASSYGALRVATLVMPLALAKPVVDCALYAASYAIQKRFVFRRR